MSTKKKVVVLISKGMDDEWASINFKKDSTGSRFKAEGISLFLKHF